MWMTGTAWMGGELYTGLIGHLLDKFENRRHFNGLKVVHAVGKAGYVFSKGGTPTSTGSPKTPPNLFFFFHV